MITDQDKRRKAACCPVIDIIQDKGVMNGTFMAPLSCNIRASMDAVFARTDIRDPCGG